MNRVMLKSKIHRAVVTDAHLDYEGSLTVDPVLLEAADILPGEKVQVVNLSNGSRIETYTIEGERDSGCMCLNGPAARAGLMGDRVIVISYAMIPDEQASTVVPAIVLVDEHNRITEIKRS